MKALEYFIELYDNPKNFAEYILGVFILLIIIGFISYVILELMFCFSVITVKN